MTASAITTDVGEIGRLHKSGNVKSARFVIDLSSQRRKPAFVAAIRETFGDTCLRVTQIHAKFITIRNSEWSLVIRTSMNLNMNPRFEDFTIGHNPDLADFLESIIGDLFKKQSSKKLDDWTPNRKVFNQI